MKGEMILEQPDQLGLLLKEILKEKSMSMGKLSTLCQIDKATISKIINGKRKANLNHLQRFANALDVSLNELMHAAGYKVEQGIEQEHEKTLMEMGSLLESANVFGEKLSLEKVKQELVKHELFSQTDEGREMIHRSFKDKIKKLDSIGPYINHLEEMYERFSLKKGTPKEIALVGGGLLYFILSLDLIPDYFFPIGYLDDAMAVQIVLNFFKRAF